VAKERQRKEQIRKQRDQAHSVQEQGSGSGVVLDYVLEQAVAELPDKFRRVILLRYYSQMSCQQIADQLQQPLGTVTKTLSRAYALLRQTMTDQDLSTQSEVAG
jgi:RNA polymerase sigma factor (sigma-70 family)